ncbi:hypothetical protein ABBQ32_000946 [Trebouxia sp. C0010 RCD-2024]
MARPVTIPKGAQGPRGCHVRTARKSLEANANQAQLKQRTGMGHGRWSPVTGSLWICNKWCRLLSRLRHPMANSCISREIGRQEHWGVWEQYKRQR